MESKLINAVNVGLRTMEALGEKGREFLGVVAYRDAFKMWS